MNLKIIKYNSGNVQSVLFALKRLGIDTQITDDIDEIKAADKVIFPGVGEASTTMAYLKRNKMDDVIRDLQQPVLGICLGMQLLCEYSEEGNIPCIGVFPGKVKKFIASDDENESFKIPHIGWNQIEQLKGPLFNDVAENSNVYFVHGYYVEKNKYQIAQTNYILPYSTALQKDNFHAVQFHPEKSSKVGSQILKNFIELK